MKRGELHHDGHVSFLTDCVVMTPKQQRGILVGDDRASGHGSSVRPAKRCTSGRRNRISVRMNRYAQALYLSPGYGDFEGASGVCGGWVGCVGEGGCGVGL